jgi:hypothetical protein
LSDEGLDLAHCFADLALGFAALLEVAASEAMGVLGLGVRKGLLGLLELLKKSFHGVEREVVSRLA